MKFEGTLSAWNAERGYGAIEPRQGGLEVFVHVSAFPPSGPPPALGEGLSFEIVSGRDGRKEAAQVQRVKRRAAAGVDPRALAPSPRGRKRAARRRRLTLAAVGLVVVAGVLGWLHVAQPGGERLAQQFAGARR